MVATLHSVVNLSSQIMCANFKNLETIPNRNQITRKSRKFSPLKRDAKPVLIKDCKYQKGRTAYGIGPTKGAGLYRFQSFLRFVPQIIQDGWTRRIKNTRHFTFYIGSTTYALKTQMVISYSFICAKSMM